MNRKNDLGIRRGIPLALLIIFGAALLFQLALFNAAVNLLWQQSAERIFYYYGNSLKVPLIKIFETGGREGVEEYLRGLSTNLPGLKTVILRDMKSSGPESPLKSLSGADMEYLKSGNVLYLLKGKKWAFFIPLSVKKGIEAYVEFQAAPVSNKDQRRIYYIVASMSIFYVVILYVFTIFVFRRRISTPLSKYLEVVKKLESGEEGVRIKEMPPNELGLLGDVFNRALDSIERKRAELEDIVGALKRSNEELERSRSQIIKMEKFATIGSLASGIAHEVGNPLMAIKGYGEYLLKNSDLDEEQRDCLERVIDESKRVEGIIKGLLAHARVNLEEGEEADGEAILDDIIESLSYRKIFEGIKVTKEFGGIPRAAISPGRLRQVLLNIILNSVDAMSGGGTLRVATLLRERPAPGRPRWMRRKTDPVDSDFSVQRNGPIAPERGETEGVLVIEISDTGGGIREEDRRNIFDPFFTTKEPGKGTGLGLSVASAIIDMYGGTITFSSNEGVSTTFVVTLLPSGKPTEASDEGGWDNGNR